MMKGIDWSALPIVFDLLGVEDPELMLNHLLTIRDNQEASHD